MSFLIDTDILCLLERKRIPPRLSAWIRANEAQSFLSVVSMAELQFGVSQAPATHQPAQRSWLAGLRQTFASAIEPLDEPTLVRWKTLLVEMKRMNRTLTCEDSLIAATALQHGHVVVSRNRDHFAPSGVAVLDPLSD
jgi:toxin FitB